MAITVAMRTEVSQLYVALFGRAPDSEGLGFWVNLRNQGQSLTQIANSMFATAPARDFFPTWMTNQEIIASFYSNVLGRTADAEGLAFWTAKLNAAGATPGSVITQLIANVANYTGTNPDGILSAKLFNNSVQVAQYYAEHGGTIANSTAVLAGVTDQTSTVTAAIAAINNGTVGAVPDSSQTLTLSVGQDSMSGGTANDTFNANVVQNQLGEQVNTLGSGDSLNGGAGFDTLNAKITAGAFVGSQGGVSGTQSMPIQPETSGIEMVKLEAVNSNISGGSFIDPFLGIGTTTVYVNAKDMLGVNTIGSWHSDANLVIQNMTTQDNNGVGRELSDMTVLMGYTGNRDSHWNESNLSVYFDQDYLNPSTSFTRPSVDIRLMNEDKYDVDYAAGLRGTAIQALAGVYVEKLVITVNGQPFSLAALIGELGAPNSDPKTDFIKTYPQLLAAVQAAVTALKAANPGNAALQTLTATDGGTFLSDISPVSGLQRVGESVTLSIDGSTNGVPNTLVVQAQDLVLDPIATTTIPNSNRFERADITPAIPSTELSINIELEKAGLAGDGGQLIVGSMFKDGTNVWNDLYDGKGIAVFDVTVSGASDKPSSLSGLHSTGNNLREVNVVTNAAQTGTFADLRIGNSNTSGLNFERVAEVGDVITPTYGNSSALKDVQTFDASGFKGDLTLFAALTDEVTDKYMNVVDQAPDLPAADNIAFTYSGGSGNDYINLWLSEANFDDAGTTTREDFVLTINGGAGNDEIVTMIGNGSSGEDSSPDHWYLNSKINANLTVNGGDGNDTIRTLGAGDWVINGNAGNDTIYSDNTGQNGRSSFNDGRAVWVFNALNTDVTDLLSQAAATVSGVNATLTVEFRDLTKTVNIGTSMGALANVSISDLTVNQAIKLAINSDPVLSKLLVAEDGPARTLIVRSLIDGAVVSNDLTVTFGSTALAGAQTSIAGLTVFAASTTLADGYTTGAGFVQSGAESFNSLSDNTITGGTGNDVIVLGTTGYMDPGTPASGSNETVVYNAAFGNDTIVNFDSSIHAGTTTVVPAAGVAERITVTFSASDGSPQAETIIFDGFTVNLSAPVVAGVIPAIDVANQFADQFNSANWSVAAYTPGTNVVTLVRDATGVTTDAVPADFTGTYFGAANGNGTVTVATTVQGVTAGVVGSPTSFVVTFDTSDTAAVAAGSFVFDGVTVNYAAGDGSITLTNKLAAATFPNWTVVKDITALDPTVTFTAKTNGVSVQGTAADFDVDGGTLVDGVIGSVAQIAPGVADVGTIITTVIPAGPGEGVDYLDFRGIGGDLDGTNFQSLVLDKSIVVAAETSANNEAAEVAALFTDSATAMTHVYVAYDANNVADVWAVSDPVGTGARTATLMGTIDLADTPWASLTAVNFL